MSEVHDQAMHLLATPQLGTYLTPEAREMVLRALDEEVQHDGCRAEMTRVLADLATATQRAEAAEKERDKYLASFEGCVADLGVVGARAEAAEAELARSHETLALVAAALHNVGMAKDSPAAPAKASNPPLVPTPELAGDVVPAVCLDGCERKGTPHRLCKIVDDDFDAGAAEVHEALATTGTPDGGAPEAQWGRTKGERAGWHLWYHGDAEALCGETTDAEVVPRVGMQPMDRETVCIDCGESDHPLAIAWRKGCDEADDASELNDGNATIVRSGPVSTPVADRPTCVGWNKSANVVCGTKHVHVQIDGQWFCRRHDPRKKSAPGEAAEATNG